MTVLVAVGAVAAAALAVKASISIDAAGHAAEQALSAMIGEDLRLTGSATTRLLPWPAVRFDHAAIVPAAGGEPIARMDRLDASLDVAALLLGRVRPDEVRLVRPEIRLGLAAPRFDLADIGRRLADWRPGTVIVEQGRIVVAGPAGEESLEAVEGRLAWPRPSANIDLRATFRWRAEPVEAMIETPSADQVGAGRGGRFAVKLTSPAARLVVTADLDRTAAPRLAGDVDIDLTDAGRFARWAGLPRHPDLLAGHLRLTGRLGSDERGLTLSGVKADLAGNRGEGVLAWRTDLARPRLTGTLAFDTIDLVEARTRPFAGGWAALPLDRDTAAADLDLRFSANRVKLPNAVLDRVAASLLLADGRVNAELGAAELFGRPIAFVMRGGLDADGLRAQVRASGDDLPAADLAALVGVVAVDGGRITVSGEGETRCRTLSACRAGTDALVRVTAADVSVTGASPFAEVSRFHPIVPQPAGPRVTTSWDRADASLALSGSRVTFDRITIEGRSTRLLLSGRGDIDTLTVDLQGTAAFPAFRADPAKPGANEITVPLRVSGPLGRLEVTPRDAPARDLPPADPLPTAPTGSTGSLLR